MEYFNLINYLDPFILAHDHLKCDFIGEVCRFASKFIGGRAHFFYSCIHALEAVEHAMKRMDSNDRDSLYEPKAYDLASKVINDTDITELLRRAAVSYSRCGLLIHALEAVEHVMKRMDANDRE
eukprot:154745_1